MSDLRCMYLGIYMLGVGVEFIRWDATQKVYEEVCARRVCGVGLLV